MNKSDVPKMLPDIIEPIPNNKYVLGGDFSLEEKALNVVIFNTSNDTIEYTATLFTTSKANANLFAKAIAEFFDAKIYTEGL